MAQQQEMMPPETTSGASSGGSSSGGSSKPKPKAKSTPKGDLSLESTEGTFAKLKRIL
jgi:hypothetical protein